jgi:ubiquitin-protein ligase/stress response protein SCP2
VKAGRVMASALQPEQLKKKRIYKEWKELIESPVERVAIAPLTEEELLTCWHGNIQGQQDTVWDGIVVHFVITFPLRYPNAPPKVLFCTEVPHINVLQKLVGWEVCLDMLDTAPLGSSTMIPYTYWSSAFSVRSILLQITSFCFCADHVTTSNIVLERVRTAAKHFSCKAAGCPHSHAKHYPELPSEEAVRNAPLTMVRTDINGDAAQRLHQRIFTRRNKEESKKAAIGTDNVSVETNNVSASTELAAVVPQESQKAVVAETEVWTTVGIKKSDKMLYLKEINVSKESCTVATAPKQNLYETISVVSGFGNVRCSGVECNVSVSISKAESHFSKSQLYRGSKGEQMLCFKCVETKGTNQVSQKMPKVVTNVVVGAAPVKEMGMGKSSSALKRERKKKKKLTESTIPKSDTLIDKNKSKSEHAHDIDISVEEKIETLIDEEVDLGKWKDSWLDASDPISVMTNANMAKFSTLSRDAALIIISYLQPKDVLSLGTTCRGNFVLTNDWLVWKYLFQYRFPRSGLAPRSKAEDGRDTTSSWKHAYMLEANGCAQDLHCFHSLATKDDDVLGMPIEVSHNPKTHSLDYAFSQFDVLSLSSYKAGIRRTMWGESFGNFLPYYIDEDHFKKSLSIILRTATLTVERMAATPKDVVRHQETKNMNQIWRAKGGNQLLQQMTTNNQRHGSSPAINDWTPTSKPEMAMTLICKLMVTQVILLCDNGIQASEAALTGYCQLHRLLLGLIDHYPELRLTVHRRLDQFIRHKDKRVKSECPALGDVMALLSVSETYSYEMIHFPYLMEAFDRSILWSCTKDEDLSKVTKGDMSRLDRYLETQKVSMRMQLFHSVFLHLLVKGGGNKEALEDCKDKYDIFQGRPPLHLRRAFQNSVNEVLSFDTWPKYFQIAKVPLPSKDQLLNALEEAVGNSLKKGYHDKDTDFSKIHKSGVSRILLKGQSYSADPNISKISLIDTWKYNGEVKYLDASALVYDFDGKNLSRCDYTSQYIGGYLNHSGDIIEEETSSGRHTIDINVKKIPSNVKAIFIVLSAWHQTLDVIEQPSCYLFDKVKKSELCRYIHDNSTADNQDFSSVIMCKFHRPSLNSRWEMKSIGKTGYGCADVYGPIHSTITDGGLLD